MTILAVIPARYASSRFPGKPLADIDGKPMIWHVYQAALKTMAHEVVVATEDMRIVDTCNEYGMAAQITESTHPAGSDRTAEIAVHAGRDYADIIVNIQGDEPLIEPSVINEAIDVLLQDESVQVSNLCATIQDAAEVLDPNTIKVVRNEDSYGVYLSRSPVPYHQSRNNPRYEKQVCVYAFRPDALRRFAEAPRGRLEQAENIELLRFMELGIPVKFRKVHTQTMSVDTPADLERVKAEFEKRKVPA